MKKRDIVKFLGVLTFGGPLILLTRKFWLDFTDPIEEVDVDAERYFASLDPPLDKIDRNRISAFVTGLKKDGLWAHLDALWVLASSHSQAATVNLKEPATYRLLSEGSPNFVKYRGFTLDGETQYLPVNTQVLAFQKFQPKSGTIGVFAITPGSKVGGEVGTLKQPGVHIGAEIGPQVAIALNDVGAVGRSVPVDYPMLAVGVRRGQDKVELHRMSAGQHTVTKLQQRVSAAVGDLVLGASALGFSNRAIGAAFVGSQIPDEAIASMHKHFQNYMSSIGIDYSDSPHFADTIGTQGWTRSSGTPAYFDEATQATWLYYEAWNWNSQRLEARCKRFDHRTNQLSDEFTISDRMLTDDSHGTPVGIKGPTGHHYAFYGSHNSPQLCSRTNQVDDPSVWVDLPSPGDIKVSYPHPALVLDTLYLFNRGRMTSENFPLGLIKATFADDGTPMWGAQEWIFDLGHDSRVYPGLVHVVGTEVHLVCARANAADTERSHVYYLIYDTENGSVHNFSRKYSTTRTELPVRLEAANDHFRIFEHNAGATGTTPQSCFDTDGRPHVVFCHGSITKSEIKHIWHDGSTWSAPETIGEIGQVANFAIYPLGEREVAVAWGDDPGGLWRSGGDMVQRTWQDGIWKTKEVIRRAVSYGLDGPFQVRNAHPDARLVFGERGLTDSLESGMQRTYAHGDSGFVVRSSA